MFSMRSDEIPSKYKLIKNLPTTDRSGKELYAIFCSACHSDGKTAVFEEVFDRSVPAITNPDFLNKIDDKTLRVFVDEGRTGTQMTAWKHTASGVKKEDVDKIMAYLSQNRSETVEPFSYAQFQRDPEKGKAIYDRRCSFCHGEKGKGGGRKLGLNLRNDAVQKIVDPSFLATTVRNGRKGTPMPAFGTEGEGLTDQQIADVVGYVKTLGKK